MSTEKLSVYYESSFFLRIKILIELLVENKEDNESIIS